MSGNIVDFPGADREVSEREVNDLHAEHSATLKTGSTIV
jgi:hypothetical protein